jgi:hypothetical protein
MERFPVPEQRRRLYERLIRWIDLLTYIAVFFGGVYALIGTPASVADELVNWEWLIGLWSGLLLAGGLVGFIGRLSRRWMIEVPATVLAFFGVSIYIAVLGRFAFTSITAVVAALLIIVAALVMLRRWAELQIFSTDPHAADFKSRVAQALRRRTNNFVQRDA